MKDRRRYLLFTLLWFIMATTAAQEFSVKLFRQLPNDISAFIQPVKDLNGEACALLKVVGETDYAFSTPLGIVKRRNEIGEIWLYVPAKTQMLTIKHPQWGVLRDYPLSTALEGRMTYELVLSSPLVFQRMEERPMVQPRTVFYRKAVRYYTPHLEGVKMKKPAEKEKWFALLQVGAQLEQLSVGVRGAYLRRHGVYLLAQSDGRLLPDTKGECERDGTLTDKGGLPYYTGKTRSARYLLLAGGIHRIVNEVYLFEGAGYGNQGVAWQLEDGDYVKNIGLSTSGWAGEIGMLYRYKRRYLFSASVQTIGGNYWEGTIGIGLQL